MPIEVKSFDDIEAVAADAGGALDRAAQRHLHDRLEWFRLAEAYRPSQGRARIWRADDGEGGRAWLFLSVNRGGRAEALALWYTLAFRPVFAGEVGPTVTSSGTQNVVGYDCSGLTMRAYQAAGISLGHYTGLQWDEGMHVSRDQLVPGDLAFFATDTSDPSTIHHVGIYIGNGQMIDAPQTGEQIGIHNAFRSDYIGAVQP